MAQAPALPKLDFNEPDLQALQDTITQQGNQSSVDNDLMKLLDEVSPADNVLPDNAVTNIITQEQPATPPTIKELSPEEATAQAEALLAQKAKQDEEARKKAEKENSIIKVKASSTQNSNTTTRRVPSQQYQPHTKAPKVPQKINKVRLQQNVSHSLQYSQALLDATASNDLSGVIALLKKGVAADVIDTHGNSPLMIATAAGNAPIIKALLLAKANVNHRNNYGVSPLQLAILANHTDLALQYIKLGADVSLSDNLGSTALVESVYAQNLPVLQSLIARGANANIQDSNGNSMLHISAMMGNVPITHTLLQAGVDARRPNTQGLTALDVAGFKGNQPLQQLLLQAAQQPVAARPAAAGPQSLAPVEMLPQGVKQTPVNFTLPLKPQHAVAAEALLHQWNEVDGLFSSLTPEQKALANNKRLALLSQVTSRTGQPGLYAEYVSRLPQTRLNAFTQSQLKWETWAKENNQPGLANIAAPRQPQPAATAAAPLSPERTKELAALRARALAQAAAEKNSTSVRDIPRLSVAPVSSGTLPSPASTRLSVAPVEQTNKVQGTRNLQLKSAASGAQASPYATAPSHPQQLPAELQPTIAPAQPAPFVQPVAAPTMPAAMPEGLTSDQAAFLQKLRAMREGQ